MSTPMRFRCHRKRTDRFASTPPFCPGGGEGGGSGGTPLCKRNWRQRNVPKSLQHEQNRCHVYCCHCRPCQNSPKTISSKFTHFQQSSLSPKGSMYKIFDHLSCFSAYSFSPVCRAARFIPRLTKTHVTPRRSNNKSSFCNKIEQRNLHLRPPLLRHITFSRIKNAKAQICTHLQTCTGLEWT